MNYLQMFYSLVFDYCVHPFFWEILIISGVIYVLLDCIPQKRNYIPYQLRRKYVWIILCYVVIGYFAWNFFIVHEEKVRSMSNAISFFAGYATFGATTLALLNGSAYRWIYSPKLILEPHVYISNAKIKDDYNPKDKKMYDGYALRLKVRNEGTGRAENVQIRIESENPIHLSPTNLIWTNHNISSNSQESKISIEKMYLGLDYFCDLGEMISKDKTLRLTTAVIPFNKECCLKEGSRNGFYIHVYATNLPPIKYYLNIDYKQWSKYLVNMEKESFLFFNWNPKLS